MSRFPHALPGESPAALAPGEEAQLLALAQELQSACPEPPVAADFAEQVRGELARSWSLRRTLEASRLARAAATLLVISLAVAPIVALVQVLPWLRPTRSVISIEPYLPAPAVEEREHPNMAELPAGPPYQQDAAWVESVLRQNRMARAADSWSRAGSAAPRVRDPASGVAAWEQASAEDLWQEFLRACARGGAVTAPPGLEARLRVLAQAASPAERRLLAPWLWVLHGELLPAGEMAPELAWPGAPWLAF